jgi:hypothetical protein
MQTGNDLLGYCSTPNSSLFCLGYVEGVADTMARNDPVLGGLRACIPAGVTGGQLRDITVKMLQDRPEIRQNNAASIVASALSTAFPCR